MIRFFVQEVTPVDSVNNVEIPPLDYLSAHRRGITSG
jgi:hypothetical protein